MLIYVLEESLKLLHPFLPFITEEIWGKLPGISLSGGVTKNPLIVTDFPQENENRHNETADNAFSKLMEIVTSVRTLRSEFTIPPSKQIKIRLELTDANTDFSEKFSEMEKMAAMLVRSDDLKLLDKGENTDNALAVVGRGFTAYLYIKDMIDTEEIIKRFEKSLEKTLKIIDSKKKKLSNEKFVSRAPAEIIEREKSSLKELEDTAQRSSEYLNILKA
jgi:valyl-tRNA synthetase